jgi:hypothetical protein
MPSADEPLLQLRELGFGLLQDWDVEVGVIFQSARKLGTAPSRFGLLQENHVRVVMAVQDSEALAVR